MAGDHIIFIMEAVFGKFVYFIYQVRQLFSSKISKMEFGLFLKGHAPERSQCCSSFRRCFFFIHDYL